MPTATAVVIGNTRSGAAIDQGEALLEQLSACLKQTGRDSVRLPFPDVVTDAPARRLMRQYLDAGADRVYVLGGDGTVRAVAELLLGRDVPLGIVPAGTANLLARDLGLPPEPEQAIEALATAQVRHIDVARCNGKIFLCAAMFGMSTDLARAREAARGVGAWRMLPQLLRRAWWVLRRYPFHRVRLYLDDEPVALTTRALMVTNNPLAPRPGLYPPRASLDSAQFGVYGVREGPLYDLPRLAVALLAGTWTEEPRLFHRVCRRLRIEAIYPRRTVALLDGEHERLRPPLIFDLLPAALPVLAPA
jgi:diacylglycerol kinase family enzyme